AERIAGITLLAVGGAALIAGIAAGVRAKSASDSINAAARKQEPFDPSQQSTGKAAQIASDVMYALGAAGLGSGTILVILGTRKTSANLSFAPSLHGATFSFGVDL